MLVAAAVCPHPPLLVPGVASGAAAETDDLRAAAAAAVRALVAAGPELVVVVGAAPQVGPCDPQARGSLAPYGVNLLVGSEDRRDRRCRCRSPSGCGCSSSTHPTCRGCCSASTPRRSRAVAPHSAPTLADRAPRVAMLVMGDGSARRSLKGPGYLDESRRGLRRRSRSGAGCGRTAVAARPRPRSGRRAARRRARGLAGARRRGPGQRRRRCAGAGRRPGICRRRRTASAISWRPGCPSPAKSGRRSGAGGLGGVAGASRRGCRRSCRRACPARSSRPTTPLSIWPLCLPLVLLSATSAALSMPFAIWSPCLSTASPACFLSLSRIPMPGSLVTGRGIGKTACPWSASRSRCRRTRW